MFEFNILAALERIPPFLPPGLSVASRIVASRSIRPAPRKAVVAIDLLPDVAGCVERDIAMNLVYNENKWARRSLVITSRQQGVRVNDSGS